MHVQKCLLPPHPGHPVLGCVWHIPVLLWGHSWECTPGEGWQRRFFSLNAFASSACNRILLWDSWGLGVGRDKNPLQALVHVARVPGALSEAELAHSILWGCSCIPAPK